MWEKDIEPGLYHICRLPSNASFEAEASVLFTINYFFGKCLQKAAGDPFFGGYLSVL